MECLRQLIYVWSLGEQISRRRCLALILAGAGLVSACTPQETQVGIQLVREGAPSAMSVDEFTAAFPDTRDLVVNRDTAVRENRIDLKKDFFFRLDVTTDLELRHFNGQESKIDPYNLNIDGHIYFCDQTRDQGFRILAFINPAPAPTPGYHYAFVDYIPFMWLLLSSPPRDLCIDIETQMPNKVPYGSTHYYSNTIRVSANELNTLLAGLPQ